MTNELDEDDYIVEFISAGGKNYDYTTRKGKVECRVKGFSMNLNYQVMKQNILNEIRNPLEEQRNTMVAQPKFTRDVKTKWIRTETQVKKYGLVFDKRALDETYLFKSYP
ncbi:hypothetical protein pdam_00025029 [Pocillopora damicornis]|uniref:Uncharacterized protein n=1 Tax=Pocillopora damicornis TaxID=46731 RepID=A0A3M6U450_POCDA|nr:hypothetical protein pdam_00025029 [Pocillopora damicornis]